MLSFPGLECGNEVWPGLTVDNEIEIGGNRRKLGTMKAVTL